MGRFGVFGSFLATKYNLFWPIEGAVNGNSPNHRERQKENFNFWWTSKWSHLHALVWSQAVGTDLCLLLPSKLSDSLFTLGLTKLNRFWICQVPMMLQISQNKTIELFPNDQLLKCKVEENWLDKQVRSEFL